jgi:hypothetical protein
MGWIMVVRYRPMRVDPTMTTSSVMAKGSFLRLQTLEAAAIGVNRQFAEKSNSQRAFSIILLRQSGVLRNISQNRAAQVRPAAAPASDFRAHLW